MGGVSGGVQNKVTAPEIPAAVIANKIKTVIRFFWRTSRNTLFHKNKIFCSEYYNHCPTWRRLEAQNVLYFSFATNLNLLLSLLAF